jgi:hemerythrin-like domain-containing protein
VRPAAVFLSELLGARKGARIQYSPRLIKRTSTSTARFFRKTWPNPEPASSGKLLALARGRLPKASFDFPRARITFASVTILESLVAEHRVFLKVFAQIERLLPTLKTGGEVAALCQVVAGLLHDHGLEETDLAYIALDHILKDHDRHTRLYHDHQEIDELLNEVGAIKDLAEASSRLKAALVACRAHFDEEERNVFPLIKDVLQPETLQILGRARKLAQSSSSPQSKTRSAVNLGPSQRQNETL